VGRPLRGVPIFFFFFFLRRGAKRLDTALLIEHLQFIIFKRIVQRYWFINVLFAYSGWNNRFCLFLFTPVPIRLDKLGHQPVHIRVRQPRLSHGVLAVDVQLLRRPQAQPERATQPIRHQVQQLLAEPSVTCGPGSAEGDGAERDFVGFHGGRGRFN
jgi:hypothetical protein